MLKTYWLIAIRKMLRYFELSYDTFHPNKDRI